MISVDQYIGVIPFNLADLGKKDYLSKIPDICPIPIVMEGGTGTPINGWLYLTKEKMDNFNTITDPLIRSSLKEIYISNLRSLKANSKSNLIEGYLYHNPLEQSPYKIVLNDSTIYENGKWRKSGQGGGKRSKRTKRTKRSKRSKRSKRTKRTKRNI